MSAIEQEWQKFAVADNPKMSTETVQSREWGGPTELAVTATGPRAFSEEVTP